VKGVQTCRDWRPPIVEDGVEVGVGDDDDDDDDDGLDGCDADVVA